MQTSSVSDGLLNRILKPSVCRLLLAGLLLLGSRALAQTANAEYVTGLYFATLGAPPDPTGWTYWYQTLQQQQLSQAQVTNYFLTSPTYFTNCTAALTDTNGKNTCPGSACITQYPSGNPYSSSYTCQANVNPQTGLLDNQDFLTLLYWDALSRAPDASGWANWYTDELQASPPVPQSTVVSGISVPLNLETITT